MGRIRTIKPETPHSESLGRCSRDARLAFVFLWTLADDHGKLRGSSRMLASLLFPYDDDAPGLITGWLAELEREDCIRRYVVGSDHYVRITKWPEHQKIDRPTKSRLPDFDESSRALAKPREPSTSPREASCEDLDQDQDQEGTKDRGPPREQPRAVSAGGGRQPKGLTVRVEKPETPGAEWLGQDLQRWAQWKRQEIGLVPEEPVPILELEQWWGLVRTAVGDDVTPVQRGFIAFGKVKYWQDQDPPLPLRGFMSQWRKFVRLGVSSAQG